MSDRVLIVDDDADVLLGLRRGLWRHRERFACSFAGSAREAMQMLRHGEFAVAIVDLEMPEIDGTELLDFIRAHHPSVVRIAFSGSCEARRCLDALSLAHRFVDKPCSTDRLVEHIETCLRAGGPGMRFGAAIQALAEPGVLPEVYHDAIALLSDERCSTRRLAAILDRDIGATTRLLRLANSSWWSPARPITDVERAIAALGLEIVRSSLLMLGLAGFLDESDFAWVDDITMHGLAIGELSAVLVDDRRDAATARTAGLLHDIGRIAIARSSPDDYHRVSAAAASDERALLSLELDVFGVHHGTVGGFLLRLWNLPIEVARAVAQHHEPAIAIDRVDPAQAVRLAELVLTHGLDALARDGGCTPACLVRVAGRALEFVERHGGETGS